MHSSNARLTCLFNSYYNKTATKQEIEELFQLVHAISDDELTLLMREAWENLEIEDPLFEPNKSLDMLKGILPGATQEDNLKSEQLIHHRKRSIFNKFMLTVAASVLFVLGFGIYVWINQTKEAKPKPVTYTALKDKDIQLLKDVLPGSNKAMLTLPNGSTIILDNAKNGTLVQRDNFEISKTKDGELVYQTTNNIHTDQSTLLNMISTPRGGQYQVVLSDGTKVWLNAASSLKFPSLFKGKTRDVELTGEAYFEVAKNAKMPFNVKSKNAEINVLGTHFNVRAYDDESIMKTTLLEGSVKITGNNSSNVLKPGEQAIVNNSDKIKVINDVDVDEETAWKNGLFQFKDAGIESIMKQAALWYDLNISYEGKIPQKSFTGKISKYVKASEFFSMLRYAGINIKVDGENIIVTN